MTSFEQIIADIDNEISIQKEDREVYTKDFDIIRNYVLGIMQQVDPVFKEIYAGPSLFGSYSENVKIGTPDEFDVHFVLQLPYFEEIKVVQDKFRPGFVKVDLWNVLKQMKADESVKFVFTKFRRFTRRNKYLFRSTIQQWLRKIIIHGLEIHGDTIRSSTGELYKLTYRPCSPTGTAHTFTAKSRSREIYIDLVPAFRFDASNDWLGKIPFPEEVPEKLWFAVPKIGGGPKTSRRLTYNICVPQAEKYLLTKKHNLKISLRLLKSLRDRAKLYPLKSYFIRSIYLHENNIQKDEFWMQPPGQLLMHMIDRLLDYLNDRSIPFYWSPELNLLEGLEMDEILEIKTGILKAKRILEACRDQPTINEKQLRSLFNTSTKPLSKEYA